jgi:hypothetical protein
LEGENSVHREVLSESKSGESIPLIPREDSARVYDSIKESSTQNELSAHKLEPVSDVHLISYAEYLNLIDLPLADNQPEHTPELETDQVAREKVDGSASSEVSENEETCSSESEDFDNNLPLTNVLIQKLEEENAVPETEEQQIRESPQRKICFSSQVQVGETYHRKHYSREKIWCADDYIENFKHLLKIRRKLNSYKKNEMKVHEESRQNTKFYKRKQQKAT